ncbi:MAG TPA: hypothetical protein VF594_07405 [Rubricoccaceae bacterium]
MRLLFLLLALTVSRTATSQPAVERVPLIGDWQLNRARTHYGPGVDQRHRERFTCAARGARVACTIRGERADGRVVIGRFTAALNGTGAPVTGVPGIDEVRLRAGGAAVTDATFLRRGVPVFGYRAYRSEDGRSLMIVAVDPISRAARSTVVVYDRR